MRIQAFDFSQTNDISGVAFEGNFGIMDETGLLDEMIHPLADILATASQSRQIEFYHRQPEI